MTVTDFQLHNLGRCSKIPIYYAMFGNFDGIENGGFHRLSAQWILDDSGPLTNTQVYRLTNTITRNGEILTLKLISLPISNTKMTLSLL